MKKHIGNISVDAGIVWLGDPCYILHKTTNELPATLGRNWDEFCEKLGNDDTVAFNHEKGFEGLGVVVSSGYGDGLYPVYAEIKDGRIKSVEIKFF